MTSMTSMNSITSMGSMNSMTSMGSMGSMTPMGHLSQPTVTPEELQFSGYGGPEGSMLSALHSFIDGKQTLFIRTVIRI